jgi:hypothetical protein
MGVLGEDDKGEGCSLNMFEKGMPLLMVDVAPLDEGSVTRA